MNTFTEEIKGQKVIFKTKPGVFSSHGLDSGTRLLIDTLESSEDTLVADLGSGTGVLGIVLARMNYKGHVHLLEDNLRAVELAKENVELNKLRNAEVYLSDLFSAVPTRSYHQIYSNPPAQLGNEFLGELIKESFKHLKPGGELIMVIVKHLKNPIERMLESTFRNSKMVTTGADHIVIKSVKEKKD